MTERIFQGSGRTIRNIVAAARRLAGLKRKDSPVTLISGGEDNLYRVHVLGGIIVEGTIDGGVTQIDEVRL